MMSVCLGFFLHTSSMGGAGRGYCVSGSSIEPRVDTQVSFIENSREFYVKQVSYFAKKAPCFTKLAVAYESQF